MSKWSMRAAAPVLVFIGTVLGSFAADVTIAPPTTWPKSDIPTDPSVTFGTLPNGMRYLIKPNTHPEHGVSVYLRIAAGSFDESPKETGISHFVEHMSFRGTTHIPDGEVIKRLQQIGVTFGTDANAFTSANATVYTFDFPGNDATTLDTALTLTRDVASEVQFDPKAVDSERQVVLSEYRLRDTPVLHMAKATQVAMYGERLAEAYMPIGSQAAISAATSDELKTYYRAHYRPERAVLIVVGDVDAKAIEAEIKVRFSDWKAAVPKPAAPKFTYPDPPKSPTVHLFVENGANSAVQFTWVSPFDPTPETLDRDVRDAVRQIALRVVNLRLHALATSADPPFLGAGINAGNSYRTTFVASIGASVGSGDPKRAITALRQTLMTVLRDGFTQDEVDRAIAQERTNLASQVTSAPSRKNHQLTGTFNSVIGKDEVIDGPENWSPTFEAAVKGLTAARVTAEFKVLFPDRAPRIIVSSPTPVAGGSDALLAAYNEVTPPVAAVASAPVVWPYTDFGPAGTITTQKSIDDLGITEVMFANGVRATIKPTKYQEGQVQILVRIGHGRFGMAKDKTAPRWAVTGAWGRGGIARIATADIPKALSGKQWGGSTDIGDMSFALAGQTRTIDVETELQFLAATITDPAWRPEALQQVRSSAETWLKQAQTTPGGVYGLHAAEYVHNYDTRWSPPTPEQIKSADLKDVKAVIAPDLANGPIEVVIVGDVSLDDTLAQLKRTFGAIAKRQVDTKPVAGNEEMAKTGAAPVVFHHSGSTQEAVAMLAWKTTGQFPDPQISRSLRVLEAVIRTRLIDELRTQMGISYSPQTGSTNSWATPGWGLFTVTATVPATKLTEFYDTAKKMAADLAAKEISPDELERARGPLISDTEHAEQANGYWLYSLAQVQVEPRRLDVIRSRISGLKAVTAADVQKAAQTYLKDERSLRLIVVPEGFVVPDKLP